MTRATTLIGPKRAHSVPTASYAISTPRLTVGLRPELLALQVRKGVPPGGSGGNFSEFPSGRVSSHAPASLTTSPRLLSSVLAFLCLRATLCGESQRLSTKGGVRFAHQSLEQDKIRSMSEVECNHDLLSSGRVTPLMG